MHDHGKATKRLTKRTKIFPSVFPSLPKFFQASYQAYQDFSKCITKITKISPSVLPSLTLIFCASWQGSQDCSRKFRKQNIYCSAILIRYFCKFTKRHGGDIIVVTFLHNFINHFLDCKALAIIKNSPKSSNSATRPTAVSS